MRARWPWPARRREHGRRTRVRRSTQSGGQTAFDRVPQDLLAVPSTWPSAADMFRRLLIPDEQSRAARSVEWFGWMIMAFGVIILNAPYFTARTLHLPALETQGANYLRLAGLLVSGLGML